MQTDQYRAESAFCDADSSMMLLTCRVVWDESALVATTPDGPDIKLYLHSLHCRLNAVNNAQRISRDNPALFWTKPSTPAACIISSTATSILSGNHPN
jgi:hypothetical protein